MLVYGSEIWGTNANATKSIDKVFLWYARAILRVKSNTSNLITLGECGVIPPSVACHKQLLCYFKRLQNMCEDTLVKKVFMELNVLDTLGFSTWISSVRDLALRYNLDMNEEQSTELFKIECTKIVEKQYVSKWQTEIMDHEKHPILRTYVLYKTVYEMEPYLYLVKNPKYRIAISKIRTSSHNLENERGRYTRPITPIEKRICHLCKVVEDEFLFMLQCYIYTVERDDLFKKIQPVDPLFKTYFQSTNLHIS